jgi:hypothetical protein
MLDVLDSNTRVNEGKEIRISPPEARNISDLRNRMGHIERLMKRVLKY